MAKKKLRKNKRYKIIIKERTTNRQCISCRNQVERDNLIRITKLSGMLSKLVVNPNNHEFGRSAYICKKESCINLAIKEKKIGKMLRISATSIEQIIPTLTSIKEVA